MRLWPRCTCSLPVCPQVQFLSWNKNITQCQVSESGIDTLCKHWFNKALAEVNQSLCWVSNPRLTSLEIIMRISLIHWILIIFPIGQNHWHRLHSCSWRQQVTHITCLQIFPNPLQILVNLPDQTISYACQTRDSPTAEEHYIGFTTGILLHMKGVTIILSRRK